MNYKIERYAETLLPTQFGEFQCIIYRDNNGKEHVAMVAGDISDQRAVLCRIHSECLTSEVLGSMKCDCKSQLDLALEKIQDKGEGIVIYMRDEGRGIGLGNKIRAYALQEQGVDTVDANRMLGLPDDTRNYTVAAQILQDLQVNSVCLMTNNPLKVNGLKNGGMDVVQRIEHITDAPQHALSYLETKRARMGHLYPEDGIRTASNVSRFPAPLLAPHKRAVN